MIASIIRSTSCRILRNVEPVNIVRRQYTRWVNRTPIAIVNEDELFDSNQKPKPTKPTTEHGRRKKNKEEITKKTTQVDTAPVSTATPKKWANVTILKDNDSFITSLMTKVKSRKSRSKNKTVLLEGHRLIKDGILAGVAPSIIIFSRESDLDGLGIPKTTQLYKIPYKRIQLWSNLTTCPGVMGLFPTPELDKQPQSKDAIPLTIICDNVREPGNMGSILRVAAAVGCEKLILLKGCVDLWDTKVTRSAAGAHFRMPIHYDVIPDDIQRLVNPDGNFYVTDSNQSHASYSEHISKQATNVISSRVDLDSNEENMTARKDDIDMENLPTSLKAQSLMVREFTNYLPVEPYYSMDYTKEETILIVPGETEGLSIHTCDLLKDKACTRLNIPLKNGVDSLNVASALGIVVFEIRRQIIEKLRQFK